MLETLTGDRLDPRHLGHVLPVLPRHRRQALGQRLSDASASSSQLGQTMPERVVLVMARHGGRYVAGALNLLGDDTLYGRVWGCRRGVRVPAFRGLLLPAIDFAIAHGLARVEAGAQGPHKLQRGYEPVPTYSAHWIRDAGLSRRGRALPRRRSAARWRCELDRAARAPALPPGIAVHIGQNE